MERDYVGFILSNDESLHRHDHFNDDFFLCLRCDLRWNIYGVLNPIMYGPITDKMKEMYDAKR